MFSNAFRFVSVAKRGFDLGIFPVMLKHRLLPVSLYTVAPQLKLLLTFHQRLYTRMSLSKRQLLPV